MSELKKGMELTPIKIMLKQPNTDGNVYPFRALSTSKDEADKVIAHHKYKRCLAMAETCAEKKGIFVKLKWFDKATFWRKWQDKWLELAEKFKEDV